MVGKSKNRRRTAERLKKFLQLHRLLINVNTKQKAALKRKGMEIGHFFANSHNG
jgi:hypothetical protein